MDVYSADWVLPVDAPPIENGAVAVEDGRIEPPVPVPLPEQLPAPLPPILSQPSRLLP